ncbi:hypothetical protein ACSSS7_006226 [Eimeria intestinalis]
MVSLFCRFDAVAGTAAVIAATSVTAVAVAAAAVAAAAVVVSAAAGEEVEVSSNNRQQLLSRLAGNGDKSSSTAAAALQQAAAIAVKRDVHAMAQALKEAASECFVYLRPPDKRRVKQLLSDQRNYWGGAAVAAAELRQHRRLCHAAANLLMLRGGVWVEIPEEDWALTALINLLHQHQDKEDTGEALPALEAFLKALGTGFVVEGNVRLLHADDEEALHTAGMSLIQKLMP